MQEAPYTPVRATQVDEEEEENESEETGETDEEFDWFEPERDHNNECYFVYVNKSRRTIQPGE